MAVFIGTEDEFYTYFNGYTKNKVNSISSKERRLCNKICESCGQKSELQSAHKHGKDRKTIISSLLKKYPIKNNEYKINLNDFEKDFIAAHIPIRDHFYFLCQNCHREYDKENLNDIDMMYLRS